MSKIGNIGGSPVRPMADSGSSVRARDGYTALRQIPGSQAPAPQGPASPAANVPCASPASGSSAGGGIAQIGHMLGEARRASGVTQIDLANRLGTTQPSLARLEKDTSVPNLKTVSRYAEAIGYSAQAQLVPQAGSAVSAKMGARGCQLEGLPDELASLRKNCGVTQSQVAERMGATQPIVARLERGDAQPNLKTLEKFASAVGFDLGIHLVKNAH